ncbi:hypothetical protein ACOI1H_21030 [Loktanella sp. DJP18]|uniref:hypothetical protein n=1 Tax=Loktanella sp. DJP18 TaxID=3409788 RepID=UPI003BB4FF41
MDRLVEKGGRTHLIEGMLASQPEIGTMPGGASFATCMIRTSGIVGDGEASQNTTWSVVVHRLPAVEQMKAARPGDLLEIHGVVAESKIVVPRTNGRIDILLTD